VSVLFGFLGGLAAVALKGWVDYLLEARRERRATRAATRLVTAELSNWAIWIRYVLHVEEWAPPVRDSSFAWWDEHRGLLAANVPGHTWDAITSAYALIHDVETHYKHALADDRGGLTEHDADHLTEAVTSVDEAVRRLREIEPDLALRGAQPHEV
jgi:hypothetical protein